MKYELPKLPYAYDALDPWIDKQTMEIHHTKHHQVYLDKMNGILEKYPANEGKSIEEMLQNLGANGFSEDDRVAFQNHGGGYWNHKLFWEVMGPEKQVDQQLVADITSTFGSVDTFKERFEAAALARFGSGWAWLSRDAQGKLVVYNLPNQDCPLSLGHTPIFGLDVWEHAYYLKYQNRRAEYVKNWWNVLTLL